MTYRRRFVILFSLLILASFVATWGNVEAFWQGTKPSLTPSGRDFYIRLIREGILLAIYWDAFLTFIRYRESIYFSRYWVVFATFVLVYVAFCVLLTAGRQLPMIVVVAGLRMFQYMPLILIAYVIAYYHGPEPFRTIGKVLVFYVLIQAAFALYELLFLPRFIFGITFFGPRPFGTLPSPNHFGVTMATCALYFSFLRSHRAWIFVCAFLCVASGSRTAFLGVCLVLGYMFLRQWRVSDRPVLVLTALPVIFLAYVAASTKSVSGREIESEARWRVWAAGLENIQGVADLLFGWGVGLGSNTIGTLFGKSYFRGQYMADSVFMQIIGSYGLIGVILYLSAILALFYIYRRDLRIIILLIAILFFSAVFNIWEMFPQNALLCLMLGWLLGLNQSRRDASRGI